MEWLLLVLVALALLLLGVELSMYDLIASDYVLNRRQFVSTYPITGDPTLQEVRVTGETVTVGPNVFDREKDVAYWVPLTKIMNFYNA